MRYQQPLMFPVSLDRRQARPLWQQLADQICSAVDRGVLAAGTRMPSTRTLAALLGVSRGVPMEAYELLFESGYAESRPGSGTYVTVPARLASPAPVRTPPGRVPPGRASPGSSTAGSSTAGNSTAGNSTAGPVARPAPSRHAARMARGYGATRGAARRPAGLGRGAAPDSRGAAPDSHGMGPDARGTAPDAPSQTGRPTDLGRGTAPDVPSQIGRPTDLGRGAAPDAPSQIGRPGDGCGEVDLRPGQPRAARLPLSAWRAAWRWASFRPPPGILPPLGLPELRHAVAEHVRRTYGALPPGREVVVTTGTVAGLRAVLAVLGLSGPDVAVQEPIAPSLWRAAQGGTGRPVAVPVDHEGARIDRVPDRCPALLLCPDSAVASGVLSAERRYRTVRRPGTWLVEVGCDGVLPAAAQRLPRLLSLAAPETSVLVGGFGEVFAPVLGIGFALVPQELAGAIGRYLADCSGLPPYVSQLALARLLRDGTVERVMHRLDRDDRSGLHLARAALDCVTLERTGRPAAPDVGVPVTGMRGTALLPLPGADAATVAARLRDRGVRVGTLAPYHFSTAPVPPALVVGYGHLTEPALRHGLERLAAALPAALSAAPPAAPRAALPATPPSALPADRRSSEG